jgi:hypothetical protein
LEAKHKLKVEEKARRRKEQEESVARRKAEKEAQSQGDKQKLVVDEMDLDGEDDVSEVDQEEMLMALEEEMES